MADFSLRAVFGLDATGVKTELKSLRRDMTSFANDIAKIGAGVAVGAFVALAKGAIDLAGRLSDTSQNIGINVEALQALEAQHKRNGVSGETLTKSLEKTKAAVIDAASGNEKAAASLAALGLKAEALIKLPLEQQYEAIARGATNAKDQNAAYSAVCSLLGEKAGPKLMTSLRELAEEGLPAVMKSAQEAGHVMSAETIVALDRAGDAIDDFKRQATIAVGEILVNFRSEEGVKLLWLQLSDVVLRFTAGIVDAATYTARVAGNVFGAAFGGVVDYLKNGLLSTVATVAEKINKILPEKMQINIAGIEGLKTAGVDIGDRITRAIANTNPTALRDTIGEATKSMVQEQKKVVDEFKKVDLKAAAENLKNAGKEIAKDVGNAVPKKIEVVVKPPVPKSIPVVMPPDVPREIPIVVPPEVEPVIEAIKKLVGRLTRVGTPVESQTDASLNGVAQKLRGQLSNTGSDGLTQIKDAKITGNYGDWYSANSTRGELAAVERELADRAKVRNFTQRFGEDAARSQFGDTVTNKALADMAKETTRQANDTASINRKLGKLLGEF